jgi:hypothetical protein
MAYPEDNRGDALTGRQVSLPVGGLENERDDSASAAIEREINRTRRRMDETVDDLAQRFRPSSLVGDLLDYFASDEGTRMNTPQREKVKKVARRAGHGLWETIQDHPVPALLIAGSIAWILTRTDEEDEEPRIDSRRKMRGGTEPYMSGDFEPYDDEAYASEGESSQRHGPTRRRLGRPASGAAHSARHAGEWISERAGDVAHSAGETARDVGERIGEAARSTGESARRTLSTGMQSVRDAAERASHWTRHTARQARGATRRSYFFGRDRFEQGIEEYPLAMAVGSLAAGVLAGMIFPRTRPEDLILGEYSHDAKLRAQRVARQAVHRGRAAAEREGLAPHTLKDQAKDLAGRARESVSRVAEAAVGAAKDAAGRVAEAARSEAQHMREEMEDRGMSGEAIKEKAEQIAGRVAEGAREEFRQGSDDAADGASRPTAFGEVPLAGRSQSGPPTTEA